MNVKNLTALSNMLRDLPHTLEMGHWRSPCGTAACALGWAAIKRAIPKLWAPKKGNSYGLMYKNTDTFGWSAAVRITGETLGDECTDWMFSSYAYPGGGIDEKTRRLTNLVPPSAVADRIDFVVKYGQPQPVHTLPSVSPSVRALALLQTRGLQTARA
jgi:hypothetical protein